MWAAEAGRGRARVSIVVGLSLVALWAPGAAPKLAALPATPCASNHLLGLRVCLRAEMIPWSMRCIVHAIHSRPVGCESTPGDGATARVSFVLRAEALGSFSAPVADAAWRLLDGQAKPWLQTWAGVRRRLAGGRSSSSSRGLPYDACAIGPDGTPACVTAVVDGLSVWTLAVGDAAELLVAAGMRACSRLLGIAAEGGREHRSQPPRAATVSLGVMSLDATSRRAFHGMRFELRSKEFPAERWSAQLEPFQFLTAEERELARRGAEADAAAGAGAGGFPEERPQRHTASVVVLRSAPVLSGISNAAIVVAADAVKAAALASTARLLGNRSAGHGHRWVSLNASPMVGSDLGDLLPSLVRSDAYLEVTRSGRDYPATGPSVDDQACSLEALDDSQCRWALASLVDSVPLAVAPGGSDARARTVRAAMAAADDWVAAFVQQPADDPPRRGVYDDSSLPVACRLGFGRRGGAAPTWFCNPEEGVGSRELDRLCFAPSVLVIAETATGSWAHWRQAPMEALTAHCGGLANVAATQLIVVMTDATLFFPVVVPETRSPDPLVMAAAASMRPSAGARGFAAAMVAQCPRGSDGLAGSLGLLVHPRVEQDWQAHCEKGQGRACGATHAAARTASLLLQQLAPRSGPFAVCARIAADAAASPPGVIAALQASIEARAAGASIKWVNDSMAGFQAEARAFGQNLPVSTAVIERAEHCASSNGCGLDISYSMAASRDSWLAETSTLAAGITFSSMDNLVATKRAARTLRKWCPLLSPTQLALSALLRRARPSDGPGCQHAAAVASDMARLNTDRGDACAGRSPFPSRLVQEACGCNLVQEIDKLEQLTAPLFESVGARE